jgi:hypothetical protein
MMFINKTDSSVSCESYRLSNFAILINPSDSYVRAFNSLIIQYNYFMNVDFAL